jgi:hypothetical protein
VAVTVNNGVFQTGAYFCRSMLHDDRSSDQLIGMGKTLSLSGRAVNRQGSARLYRKAMHLLELRLNLRGL